MATLPRILIVADNASARFGGEAILPLKYFTLLARRGRDVHLITHARNRDALEQAFPDLVDRVTYSADTAAHRWLWAIGARLPHTIRDHLIGNLMGFVTGWQQRKLVRARIQAGQVDVVHQPIPVSPAAPSMLHGFGVPVIIGPMNGGMRYPRGYEDYEGRSSALFLGAGRSIAGLVNRLIPGKRRAALLLVANERTRRALPVRGRPVIELVENGVDFDLWPDPGPRAPRQGPLRLVFMGRLVALKGLDFAFEALARTADPVTLDILGDGEERAALEARAQALGLGERVRFLGFRPQSECATVLQSADVLILPSLRECGGAVVLEAMAMGLAVIASDWGGPADYLDPSCGILVHPEPRSDFAARLTEAIDRLSRDPEAARALGAAGAEKTRRVFDWQRKIDRIEDLYRQVTGSAPSS